MPDNQPSLAALFDSLHSSESGLNTEEAKRRLDENGANELAPTAGDGFFLQFTRLFLNPVIIILLIASAISAAVGEIVNSLIVVAMVLLGAIINFIQSFRSQRAVERLREGVAPTATVLRDGVWNEVPRRQLVVGDIIKLSAGDLVPADSRLVRARDLHIQEAALTGESLPVEKMARDLDSTPRSTGDLSNTVFLGSSVVSGTATALVISTGKSTVFGEIAARLAKRPPESEFDRGTRKFGFLIMQTVFILVIFVFLANALMHRNLIESLLFAVALAVGLTPEFLPMITAVTLARGAIEMARRNVVIKNLASMQNFGSIDILCSDKTGTLTTGEMVLELNVDGLGNPSDCVFELGYVNSFFETGIKSPLDQAILSSRKGDTGAYTKIDEVPFDFDRRRLSVVVKKDQELLLITKGAPEGIFGLVSAFESKGERRPLTDSVRAQCQATFDGLSSKGYRVLALAVKTVAPQENFTAQSEGEMVFLGFLAFSDPPLEGIQSILEGMKQDGVDVKILTGDNELVTRHICSQVGLPVSEIVLGSELEHMSDSALAQVAETASVFARVSPAQKNRIIMALKARRHVVGYMGDGINDAPSLHTADVGISVAGAVDVAKDAADIILLKKDLTVLHTGIIEGRKAFGNVMKYLLMGTSSNFGNMFSMAAASVFLPFLPMLPTQILLNNFLYDLAQVTIPTDKVDPSFIFKPRRWDIKLIRNFMLCIGPISSIYDFVTFYALLKWFKASPEFFHTGWFVESLITQTLVVFIIRTAGNPLKSRPSLPLTMTVLGVVTVGMALPYFEIGSELGFTPLPASFFVFLLGVTTTYLALVELVKRRLMRHLSA